MQKIDRLKVQETLTVALVFVHTGKSLLLVYFKNMNMGENNFSEFICLQIGNLQIKERPEENGRYKIPQNLQSQMLWLKPDYFCRYNLQCNQFRSCNVRSNWR